MTDLSAEELAVRSGRTVKVVERPILLDGVREPISLSIARVGADNGG